MTQDETIELAEKAGFDPHDMSSDFTCNLQNINAFAKLVAEKEREKWKEIVEDQRLRLQVLNEIIGGEDSTTTGNILSYSRWEMRLEDAVKEEREACADTARLALQHIHKAGEIAESAIRARGHKGAVE